MPRPERPSESRVREIRTHGLKGGPALSEGNDLALAAQLAAMTPEQRAQSEVNVRAFIAEARANLRARRVERDQSADV
jgi:hypothetical protein